MERKDYEVLRNIFEQRDTEKININTFLKHLYFSTRTEDYRHWAKDYYAVHACKLPFSFAVIHADCRVILCCGSYYICGNAAEESFKKIWNNRRFRIFRTQVLNLSRGNEAPLSCCYYCPAGVFNE